MAPDEQQGRRVSIRFRPTVGARIVSVLTAELMSFGRVSFVDSDRDLVLLVHEPRMAEATRRLGELAVIGSLDWSLA